MVSISEDENLSYIWHHPGLVLAVGGESDERFIEYCRSWMRITIMQVLIPLFAFYSAAIARKSLLDTLQRHRLRAGAIADADTDASRVSPVDCTSRVSQEIPLQTTKAQPWPIAAVVCAIEAPTLMLLGAVLALGQNGPMLLPHTVHLICSDLFLGISLLTSLLVALYLQDEATIDFDRSTQPPPLSMWSKHRRKLMAAAVVLTLSAAAPLFNIFVPMYWENFRGLFFAFVNAPLTIGCSAYFLYKAWLFRQHIMFFVCQRDALVEQFGLLAHSFRLVGCLAFWLFVSAICMLMNAAILVSVAVTMLGAGKSGVASSLINLEHFLVLESLMAVSRIGISLAQVFAISHHSVVEEGLFGRNRFRCYGCLGVGDSPEANKRRKASQVTNESKRNGPSQERSTQSMSRSGRGRDSKNRITPTNSSQGEALPRPVIRNSSDRRKLMKGRNKYVDKRRRRRSHNIISPEPASPLDGENTRSNHSSDTAEVDSQRTEGATDGLRPSPTQESMLSNEALNVGWCDLHGDYLFTIRLLEGQLDEANRENAAQIRSPENQHLPNDPSVEQKS